MHVVPHGVCQRQACSHQHGCRTLHHPAYGVCRLDLLVGATALDEMQEPAGGEDQVDRSMPWRIAAQGVGAGCGSGVVALSPTQVLALEQVCCGEVGAARSPMHCPKVGEQVEMQNVGKVCWAFNREAGWYG